MAGRLLENVDGWPIGSLAFCKLISWVELDFAEILLNINFILPNFCLGIRFLKFFAEGGFVTFLAEEEFFSFFWSCKLSISWFFLFLLDLGPGSGGLVGTVTFFDRVEGGGVAGFSSSSGMSFRFIMEKYVLSIAFRKLNFMSSAPLILFGFGGGIGKSDTFEWARGGGG